MPNPPKPTHLKVLAGNPGKRALSQHEPQPAAGVPKLPRWLSKEAQVVWRQSVREVAPGLLTKADLQSLAAFCVAVVELQWATRTLEAEGRITKIEKTGYLMPHPAIAMQRSALEQVRKLGALFGLDPSSRSRLSVTPPSPVDEFEQFLGEAN